ncbi:MAG: ABC transporter substrate-binding protein [Thermoproteus sp.]
MTSKTASPKLAAIASAALVVLALAAFTNAATIVVSFPAYDTVLREAFPQANVVLLTQGASDPHEYQLTAADVEFLHSLNASDTLVLSMHAPFELRIAEMAKNGEIRAKVIDLTKIQLYLTYDGRLTTYGPGVNLHDHGVFPPNVFRLVEAVARTTGLQPSEDFMNRLSRLNATYCCRFSGRAVALTPAAEYVLYWLGYRDIVVFIKEPGVPPAPEDLQRALEYARQGAPVLAVVVRGEAQRIVDQFIQKAREAGVQPHVVVADFSKGYVKALEDVAAEISRQGTSTTTAPAHNAAGQMGGWFFAAIIAAVVLFIAVIVVKRRYILSYF